MYARYSARICPDDQLGIIVSSKNLAAVAPYNLPAVSFMSPSTLTTVSGRENTPVMPSANQPYLVDSEGYIQFPVLGRIKLGGLTKKEAVKLLETLISEDVKEPIVTIQHMNFKVSVLGEVLRPGPFFLTNDRISILDAVALAGDLTIYGQRENVLLIRDNNGQKVFHYFDLTKSDIFKSPFFYLQQNDVIYIEPNKSRKRTTRYNQADQYNISVASTILSGISVFVALFVSVRK
jgi:polysaccharide export outer membrane protein